MADPMEAMEKALDEYESATAAAAIAPPKAYYGRPEIKGRQDAARAAVLTIYREALEDARRLDWLDRNGMNFNALIRPEIMTRHEGTWLEWRLETRYPLRGTHYRTLHSAIDAAMATDAPITEDGK